MARRCPAFDRWRKGSRQPLLLKSSRNGHGCMVRQGYALWGPSLRSASLQSRCFAGAAIPRWSAGGFLLDRWPVPTVRLDFYWDSPLQWQKKLVNLSAGEMQPHGPTRLCVFDRSFRVPVLASHALEMPQFWRCVVPADRNHVLPADCRARDDAWREWRNRRNIAWG